MPCLPGWYSHEACKSIGLEAHGAAAEVLGSAFLARQKDEVPARRSMSEFLSSV